MCRRARRFFREHAITLYYVALAVYISVIGALAWDASRDSIGRIVDYRVEQTRQACVERNEERAVLRGNFRTQRQQTRRVPAALFEQFNVTKREALARLDGAIREFHRLDCKARAAAVQDALD